MWTEEWLFGLSGDAEVVSSAFISSLNIYQGEDVKVQIREVEMLKASNAAFWMSLRDLIARDRKVVRLLGRNDELSLHEWR